MPTIKFSQLPITSNLSPTSIVPVVSGTTNFQISAADLQTYVNSNAGNITAGNVSATGNIAGQYILGNGAFLTGISGGGGNATPGGTNTQIQFNDSGVFSGNANVTYNKATGTITLGNVGYVGQRILPGTAAVGNLSDSVVTANTNPWQLIIGNSYNGNSNWSLNLSLPGQASGPTPGARVLISDVYNMSNASVRGAQLATQTWVNLQGNITNGQSRYQGLGGVIGIDGGPAGNTFLTTNTLGMLWNGGVITVGNVNANLNQGNTTVSFVTGFNHTLQVGNNSATNNYIGYVINPATVNTAGGVAGNAIIGNIAGYTGSLGVSLANVNIQQIGNIATFYHPSANGFQSMVSGLFCGAAVRMATNYHAFRNDDNLAKVRLGSIETGHYWTSNTAATSGTVTIDKNLGQYQTLYPTGNVTGMTFTNFVVNANKPNNEPVQQTDVVTLLIKQGATPYAITMPTGNSAIRYANASTTVSSVANSVTKITITASTDYYAGIGAPQYLIEIGPTYTTV